MSKNYIVSFNQIEISYLFDMLSDEIKALCFRIDYLQDSIKTTKNDVDKENLKMKLINLQYKLKILGSAYDKVSNELFNERGCN